MVNFVQVDPADLDTSRLGRRGRVSYPFSNRSWKPT